MMSETSLWHMIADAGWVVRMVMLMLLAISVISWAIIMQRYLFFRQAKRLTNEFEDSFWSGADMNAMFSEVNKKTTELFGLESIFHAGFKEFSHLRQHGDLQHGPGFVGVERRMRAASTREQDRLEHHLSFLATVGSTSPYVGLFGTVWGIMTSFSALSLAHQASLAMVAPGISEALVATAMGLFAAIPAVIAYNCYAHQVERFASLYVAFQEEFMTILHRQYQQKETAP
jgi:biopolymer transport protein TolQ